MATKTIYNRAIHEKIVDNLRAGAFRKHAAEAAGISHDAFNDWINAGLAGQEPYVQFALDVRQAVAEDAVRNVRVITMAAVRKHGGDWKAAAWHLEKKFPQLYGSITRGDETLASGDAGNGARVFSPWKKPETTTTGSVQ